MSLSLSHNMSTEATMLQLHSAVASLSDTAQRSAAEHDQVISKLGEIQLSNTHVVHWQCETDQGWQDYDAKVTAQLESAHKQSRVVAFEVNGTKYTGDTATNKQTRGTHPFTTRAIRRIITSEAQSDSKHIMALIQTVKDFAKHQAESSNKVLADLFHRLKAFESLDRPNYVWECKLDSGWVRYKADISDTIEAKYKVILNKHHVSPCSLCALA
jgi:WWE domain